MGLQEYNGLNISMKKFKEKRVGKNRSNNYVKPNLGCVRLSCGLVGVLTIHICLIDFCRLLSAGGQ